MTGFSRRSLLASATLASPLFFVKNSWAQSKSMNIGIYAGPQGDFIRKNVLPKFQSEFGCRVYPTEGVTLSQIALLRQQKANPTFSVMFMDDVGVPISRDEGLIEKLPEDKIPNLANVLDGFVVAKGFGAGFAISTIAPFYNPQAIKPIESYAELWDEKFRGRYLTPTPKQTQSLDLLVATAAIVTGKPMKEAQYEYDKAWDKLAALKPNVLTVYESGPTAALQVAQGQADIGGPDFSKAVLPYTVKGAAVDLCFPKEGSFAGTNCLTIAKGAPQPDLAAAFVNRMLDPVVQKGLAEATYAAPSVKGLTLSSAISGKVAYPEDQMKKMGLFTLDWDFFNPRRGAIVEKLNQVFSA